MDLYDALRNLDLDLRSKQHSLKKIKDSNANLMKTRDDLITEQNECQARIDALLLHDEILRGRQQQIKSETEQLQKDTEKILPKVQKLNHQIGEQDMIKKFTQNYLQKKLEEISETLENNVKQFQSMPHILSYEEGMQKVRELEVIVDDKQNILDELKKEIKERRTRERQIWKKFQSICIQGAENWKSKQIKEAEERKRQLELEVAKKLHEEEENKKRLALEKAKQVQEEEERQKMNLKQQNLSAGSQLKKNDELHTERQKMSFKQQNLGIGSQLKKNDEPPVNFSKQQGLPSWYNPKSQISTLLSSTKLANSAIPNPKVGEFNSRWAQWQSEVQIRRQERSKLIEDRCRRSQIMDEAPDAKKQRLEKAWVKPTQARITSNYKSQKELIDDNEDMLKESSRSLKTQKEQEMDIGSKGENKLLEDLNDNSKKKAENLETFEGPKSSSEKLQKENNNDDDDDDMMSNKQFNEEVQPPQISQTSSAFNGFTPPSPVVSENGSYTSSSFDCSLTSTNEQLSANARKKQSQCTKTQNTPRQSQKFDDDGFLRPSTPEKNTFSFADDGKQKKTPEKLSSPLSSSQDYIFCASSSSDKTGKSSGGYGFNFPSSAVIADDTEEDSEEPAGFNFFNLNNDDACYDNEVDNVDEQEFTFGNQPFF